MLEMTEWQRFKGGTWAEYYRIKRPGQKYYVLYGIRYYFVNGEVTDFTGRLRSEERKPNKYRAFDWETLE